MPVEGRGLSSRRMQNVVKGPGDWATYQLRKGFRNCRGHYTRKRRLSRAIASMPCTTSSTARIFFTLPMPSTAPIGARRAWMDKSSRISRRTGCSGGWVNWRQDHGVGAAVEPRAARLGELLSGRDDPPGLPCARQLHRYAVAPVAAPQVQGQATPGRDVSPLAPLRALRTRTPDPTWARRAVGEGVRSCPRAGCGVAAWQGRVF